MKTSKISRRVVLGGAGVAVALPFLESLLSREARAQARPLPRRVLFYYTPCGINSSDGRGWSPAARGVGSAWALSRMLAPLGAALKPYTAVLSGLHNRPASASFGGTNDGAGDHARGTGCFLTSARLVKTDGTNIRNGISIDQAIAQRVGMMSRFPSLQVGTDAGSSAGDCDSGYSCAYARNVSWSSATTPLPKITSPRTLFDRLFAGMDPSATVAANARRRAYSTSVLDYVRGEATSLQTRMGPTDRRKLDEYLTAIREVELRIGMMEGMVCTPTPRPAATVPYPMLVDVMHDLLALSFRCDLTRVQTFMLGNAGSGRVFDFLGLTEGHHNLSHHMNNENNLTKLETIGTWEVRKFAELCNRLRMIDDGMGTNALDNTVCMFSSEIADGNSHAHTGLPLLSVGRGGGQITTDRHVDFGGQPIADYFIALAKIMGVTLPNFGAEGTRVLANLGPVSS
ncbi:MAG: DUF1552 domain-containing protein [Deltaproteobacteria bacterium]|nr:DUF1552 domain-containing protein [Deltaproteobacteria bacterium]